ncbi:hypothetical protein [Cryobacterium sp. MLB-32]|uniref:hypothetical protein n=1 Tax=Cryobacterium sp. MLB-32 TaxID=1529318 RepID=UPI00068B72A1|nr:hypothetical protein [Cryobacterium sp. MLB-32]
MSSLEQPEQQPTPNNDGFDPDLSPESVIAADTLSVHRSPRYKNFMILGAAVGVALAVGLTVGFPGSADFTKAQIFGFLLLACLAVGVLLGGIVALVLDRVIGRRTHTVLADRLARDDSPAASGPHESTDTHNFPEKSE